MELDDTNLNIRSGRLQVGDGGVFQAGTEGAPLHSQIILTLDEPNTGTGSMGNRVLGVLTGGEMQLHGIRRDSRSWTQITESLQPGDTQMTLLHTVDWRPGDQIALAPSGYDAFEAEQLTVTANIGGRTILFEPELEFTHLGYQESIGEKQLDMRAEVGLLTRNIVIQSPEESEIDEFGFHAMFMPNSTVQIEGVEFRRGGQIRLPARYSVHWHKGGGVENDGSDDYIRRSSIHDSYQRGIVTHGINGVLVEENVVFNVFGHAYIPSEDGDEIDNRYLNNLAMLYKLREFEDYSFPRQDHTLSDQAEHRVSGFWFRNYHNILIGNHAAGGDEGIGFFADARLLTHSLRLFIVRDSRPIVFYDNHAHSHYRSISGGANPAYGPRTRATGLMVGGYRSENPVVFSGFSAYKNAFTGIWLEDDMHSLVNSVVADSSVGYFVSDSDIADGAFNQETSNQVGGPVQILGNSGYTGAGIHIGRSSTRSSFSDITIMNTQLAAVGASGDQMTFGSPLVSSEISLINASPFFQFSEINDVDAYYTDLDGTLTGTGNLTHVGGPNLFPGGVFYPEYNAYVYDTGVSNILFVDGMEG